MEIDFNLFILMCGEEYLTSDSYQFESDCEQNKYNILSYLLHENYPVEVRQLMRHYKDNSQLLLSIIDDMFFKDRYLERLTEIETLEDMSDNLDVVKIFQWAEDNEFSLHGE